MVPKNSYRRFPIDNLFWRDLIANVTYAVTVYSSAFTGIGVVPTAMTRDGRYVASGSPTTTWHLWDSQLVARIYTNTVASGNPAIFAPRPTPAP